MSLFIGFVLFWFLVAGYLIDAQWRPLKVFCAVFGHRWYFIVSFPTLESGEVFCKRCGKIEHKK